MNTATTTVWTISIISHGHGSGILCGLRDMHRHLQGIPHRFVLTFNAGEDTGFLDELPEPLQACISVIRNAQPKGFAANHNAALCGAQSQYVLAADPDLAMEQDVFGALQAELSHPDCGIVAPLARTSRGLPDDNGRRLVTPMNLLLRILRGRRSDAPSGDFRAIRNVDWLAGLFLAMRSETFDRLGGFDDRYFMYCEDVDICLRARQMGLSVRQHCGLSVTHDANRKTLKQPRHLLWHVSSLLRLWRSPAYRGS